MTDQQATTKQVRDYYKRQGLQVRISHVNNDHVEFRNEGPKERWRDGRWVSEYRVDSDGHVYLS